MEKQFKKATGISLLIVIPTILGLLKKFNFTNASGLGFLF